jgi:hypothetical protein
MPRFAPWYRREEYALVREIMEDGETFPLAFDEREKNAESERAAAKRDGVNIIPDWFHCWRASRGKTKRHLTVPFWWIAAPFGLALAVGRPPKGVPPSDGSRIGSDAIQFRILPRGHCGLLGEPRNIHCPLHLCHSIE